MVRELVPYVDAQFKTFSKSESRGIAGDFMGGYGAIRFGMRHPQIFGSLMCFIPSGPGRAFKLCMTGRIGVYWPVPVLLDDVRKDGFSTIFTAIFQAHLPNPDKSPLFVDLPGHKDGDQLVIDTKLTARLRDNFFLESLIPQYAENLKSLRGFKFDWARSDSNYDHVYSNQAFTHKLNEFGIAHEAEEYNGMGRERTWGTDGRMSTDVLPFFARHLVFDERKGTAVSDDQGRLHPAQLAPSSTQKHGNDPGSS